MKLEQFIGSRLLSSQDINTVGEALRGACFDGEGLGCYSNFDLVDGFDPIECDDLLIKTLCCGCFAKTKDAKRIRAFHHDEIGVSVFWYWDGDGTLIFKIGDRLIYNSDCKKDYNWSDDIGWAEECLLDESYYETE